MSDENNFNKYSFLNTLDSTSIYNTAGGPAATNGVNTNTYKTSTNEDLNLLKQLKELQLSKDIHPTIYKFRWYDGSKKGQEAEDFLDQFKPFESQWSNTQYFLHIQANLKKKALNWYKGVEIQDFFDLNTFKFEFLNFFGNVKYTDTTLLLLKLNEKIELSSLESYLLEIRSYKNIAGILFNDIKKTIQTKIPKWAAEIIDKADNWKMLLILGSKIQEKYMTKKKSNFVNDKNKKTGDYNIQNFL